MNDKETEIAGCSKLMGKDESVEHTSVASEASMAEQMKSSVG